MSLKVATRKWLTLDAESIAEYPDGVNQIYKGEIDGFCLKQVFSQEEMLKAKHNFESKQQELEPLMHHQKYGNFLGAMLTANGSNTTEYFKDAAAVRAHLKDIFKPKYYEETIEGVLNKMAGRRNVELARENIDRIYSPAQIRWTYPGGGGIKLHKGNEFIDLPGFEGLKQVAKVKDCLSYFLIVDKAEYGGQLVLYDGLPEQLTMPKEELDLENCQKRYADPDIGDMILFHGGTIWHAVKNVEGQTIRQSIGGFVGLSRDEQKICYWS